MHTDDFLLNGYLANVNKPCCLHHQPRVFINSITICCFQENPHGSCEKWPKQSYFDAPRDPSATDEPILVCPQISDYWCSHLTPGDMSRYHHHLSNYLSLSVSDVQSCSQRPISAHMSHINQSFISRSIW